MANSYLQIWLQRQIAASTFPADREDWYISKGYGSSVSTLAERFILFEQSLHQEDSPYYETFQGIAIERHELEVTLANQTACRTEVISFHNQHSDFMSINSGAGKHILYFTGIASLYQNCFGDITEAVRTTEASYYAFEYPGMRYLGGEVLEVNDLVNTGIAVTNDLLRKGISIDDILFQGDSFGAAIAKKVSDQFKQQAGVEIRCIMNNTFSTFQAAVQNVLNQTAWQKPLKPAVRPALRYLGWDIRPGDLYGKDTPYQIHVNHVGDLTLGHATLAELVESNSQVQNFVDPCPEDYREIRDSYNNLHWASLSAYGEQYLATKYGRNCDGLVDAHLADLTLLVYENGQGVYSTLVCKYLSDSNKYVMEHPQSLSLEQLPQPLQSETVSLCKLMLPTLPSLPSMPNLFRFFKRPDSDESEELLPRTQLKRNEPR
ncbi:Dot/Icm T4SS effector alpha/beta hydrolase [Legionella bononiensis]|uniref:Protein SdbC n=1 Tax=Legionella bononiensis TaxID=2793102 RepID=A0ABS1WBK8_9GAMM|nr:Dot/Icm T4SS effector alpha/beta hydrolase [Legionella bononiensis]MBL7481035.1 protein SdbC [Legionella bononiensis]MBL7526743.1 protein SdbC [Legionella bononiensis]MBL7564150.1 protein SdbC [Legionella bononiensis]